MRKYIQGVERLQARAPGLELLNGHGIPEAVRTMVAYARLQTDYEEAVAMLGARLAALGLPGLRSSLAQLPQDEVRRCCCASRRPGKAQRNRSFCMFGVAKIR